MAKTHWVADLLGSLDGFLFGLQKGGSWHYGNARGHSQGASAMLLAHLKDRFTRWSNEYHAVSLNFLCEADILAEKAVSRKHGIGTPLLAYLDQLISILVSQTIIFRTLSRYI